MTIEKINILLAEKASFSQKGIEMLRKLGKLDALNLTQLELINKIEPYDVLVVRLGLYLDNELFEVGRNLRFVVTPTTGIDHIDLEAAQRKSIRIISLKGERDFLNTVYSTAEHTFALLLSLVRLIPPAFNSVKEYEWRRDLFRGMELNSNTLGLVGCGRLGKMMVRYGQGFGMRVFAYDPYQIELPYGVNRCDSLNELLSRSDVVSLHIPLNEETLGMFDKTSFTNIRAGAILINTSRGAIIDENALLDALLSGQLAGAALDVLFLEHRLEKEKNHPLVEYARSHNNLLLTPHIGGATVEAVEKADLFIIKKLENILQEISI